MAILQKRSLTSGSIPTTSSLAVGEIAMNVPDGRIYLRKSGSGSDTIQSAITTGAQNSGSIFLTGSLSISGTGSVFDVAGDVLEFSGDQMEFTGSFITTGSLRVIGDTTITGSLRVSGSITGSLLGTASLATTASFAISSSFSTTASFATSASFATTASYALSGGSIVIGGTMTGATAGSVLFAGTGPVLAQNNANFFWDNTNARLGIGTISPTTALQVNGEITLRNSNNQNAVISNKYLNNVWFHNNTGVITSTAQFNVAIGMESMFNVTNATNNTAVGYQSLTSITTGASNVAIGYQSMRFNSVGNLNVAIGRQALDLNLASDNTAVGNNAARVNQNGTALVAIGKQALEQTTGDSNTALGYLAGAANTTGANNIFIGASSTGVSVTDSNRTFIGNSSTTSTWLGGNLLLGSTTDDGVNKLQVTGTAKITSGLIVTGSLRVSGSISGSFSGSYSGNGSGLTGVSATPAGPNTAIQFNDSSTASGSSNFTFTKATNTVTLQGSGSTLMLITGSRGELFKVLDSGSTSVLAVISSGSTNVMTVTTSSVDIIGSLSLTDITDPTAFLTAGSRIYSKTIASRSMPKYLDSFGVDYQFQTSLAFNNVSIIGPGGGTTVDTLGCTVTNVGTISNPNIASTNLKAQTRRIVNTSAASAGSLASTRVDALECFRGNAANIGGFFVVCRFGLTTLATGNRAFFGLSDAATSAPTNVDPLTSSVIGKVGMACAASTGNWSFVNNVAGTAPTALALGASFPIDTTTLYEMVLSAKPNSNTIDYRLTNTSSSVQLSGSISANIPTNITPLGRQAWMTNNATAAAVAFDLSRFSLETLY
jgi:hypothetical protein